MLVSGLDLDARYYFAIREAEPEPEWPLVSNVADAWTAPNRNSPEGLLDLFTTATSDPVRDLDLVASCMHADFRFYFTEEDRAGDPTLPEFWTRDDFLPAMENMMAGAIGISLEFTVTDTLPSEPCTAEPEGPTCQGYETLVELAVEVPEEPENRTYLVHGFGDMWATEETPGSGRWLLHSVRDRTSVISRSSTGNGAPPAAPATEQTTWGSVLALYR